MVAVNIGSGGDNVQHFGIIRDPLDEGADDYAITKREGWLVGEESSPKVNGEQITGVAWKLKDESVTMLLDMEARAVSFPSPAHYRPGSAARGFGDAWTGN